MSAPLPLEPPRHVHYCKDYRDANTCTARGYCECKCGARSALAPAPIEWVLPGDAKEATT